jgi:hypothetical protein
VETLKLQQLLETTRRYRREVNERVLVSDASGVLAAKLHQGSKASGIEFMDFVNHGKELVSLSATAATSHCNCSSPLLLRFAAAHRCPLLLLLPTSACLRLLFATALHQGSRLCAMCVPLRPRDLVW